MINKACQNNVINTFVIPGRKEKNLQRFKSDKHRLEGEVDDLEKKVDRMSTMKTQVKICLNLA